MEGRVFIYLALIIVSIGCSSTRKTQNGFPLQKDITDLAKGHDTKGTVSEPIWIGIYEETLTDSDHNDITTIVELRKNSTFIWISKNKESGKKKEMYRGNIIIDTKGRVLTLKTKKVEKSFMFTGKTLVPLQNSSQTCIHLANDGNVLTKI